MLDEYPGRESLLDEFGFDNSLFLDELKAERFHVVENARSNYKYTLLSLTSMFEGEYLQFPPGQPTYHENGYKHTLLKMFNNRTFNTFRQLGYSTVNLSPFKINGNEAAFDTRFIPKDVMLIMYPSLWDDLLDNYQYYVSRRLNSRRALSKLYQNEINQGFRLMDSVKKLSNVKSNVPRFVYLHLNMPHPPFIYNRNGDINLDYLTSKVRTDKDNLNAYLEYIQFVNKYTITSVKEIKKNLSDGDIIIIMSDHGSKTFHLKRPEFVFNSLNAVYIPDGDTSLWYSGFSNINQFRLLFSQITGVNMPRVKDSTIYK